MITEEMFREIFQVWYKPVRNFIYYKSGDIKVAEDITQESFLKVWEKRESVRIETIKPFIFTIATNIFLNMVSKRKVEFQFLNKNQSLYDYETPEFELELKEFDNKLQKTLAEMNENLRIVFLMNRIDCMTYHDIALALNLSDKAIEKRMKQALEYLKTKIETEFKKIN